MIVMQPVPSVISNRALLLPRSCRTEPCCDSQIKVGVWEKHASVWVFYSGVFHQIKTEILVRILKRKHKSKSHSAEDEEKIVFCFFFNVKRPWM